MRQHWQTRASVLCGWLLLNAVLLCVLGFPRVASATETTIRCATTTLECRDANTLTCAAACDPSETGCTCMYYTPATACRCRKDIT